MFTQRDRFLSNCISNDKRLKIVQHMSQSGSGKPDPDLEGVEWQKGGSASFGAKVALSLNRVDLSCMNSITGSTCRAKG